MSRKIKIAGVTAAAVLVAVQFVQPDRANPPADPAASFEAAGKPAAHVAGVVRRACRDCHSNETAWPWYSRVSPVSWLVASHVREGRAHLNFSEWNRQGPEMARLRLGEACEEAREGKMPLWQYTLLHSEAKLDNDDLAALCSAP